MAASPSRASGSDYTDAPPLGSAEGGVVGKECSPGWLKKHATLHEFNHFTTPKKKDVSAITVCGYDPHSAERRPEDIS